MYIDTHLDTLWQSQNTERRFAEQSEEGHVDLPRAQNGGLLLGFFTGYPTHSHYTTEKMVANWIKFMNNPVNKLRRIENTVQLKQHIENFKGWKVETEQDIGAVLHFEGAACIDTELNRLYIYHDIGLRSMSLTWNEENQFATGAKGTQSRGMTVEGKDLVSAMEDLGIIVDVSHLNDQSFWDMVDTTKGPIIASHSNLRKYANHPRNLTDDMVRAIGESGGSVGINFCKGFLSVDQEEHPANRFCAIYMMEEIINQIGIDHVHIGSDFDGCSVPDDVGDIGNMPSFIQDLKDKLSLTDKEINKISHENMLRIINQVWS